MQKSVMTKAVALALTTLSVGAAFAQSSVTIYGVLDVGIDNIHKNTGLTALNTPAAASTVTRVSPSTSTQSELGIKGVEDMGGGYKGNFVLEGQFSADTGAQNGQDSRMWGRQAYIGLTMPIGEVRLGRQYAPIFYNFAITTVESIGSTDMMASGLAVQNLQIRQDNQLSYWLQSDGLTAALSFSPNAGVAQKVDAMRAPYASTSTGQILGGATAGDENSAGRGRTFGLFLNYAMDPALSLNAGYHRNSFGDAQVGFYPLAAYPAGTFLPFYSADTYKAYALGAKYTAPNVGTNIAAIFHRGEFTNDAGSAEGPKVNTLAFGVKQPIDKFAVGAEFVYSKFVNFTKGKDLGVMLAGDYNFSKRTCIYTRVGFVRDSAGRASATDTKGVNLIGGPLPILTTLGSTEIPFAAGAGANAGAMTTLVSVGISHSF